MCGAILNKRFLAFPSLGNVFIIPLPKIHNVTSQLDNLSRWVVLPNKSILALIPRIYAISRQGLQPLLSSSSQRKRKKLKFNNITIYFIILLHITKLNKIIQMQSSSISSTGELFFHNKIQQRRFNLIGSRLSGGCSNRSANKVIVVVTSEVTQLGVFKRTHNNSS